MAHDFRWNEWNVDHIARHGITRDEAEFLVDRPAPGYPEKMGESKYRVRGRSIAGRLLQVIYIFDPDTVVYVIHARDLTEREKRRLRRRRP